LAHGYELRLLLRSKCGDQHDADDRLRAHSQIHLQQENEAAVVPEIDRPGGYRLNSEAVDNALLAETGS
jgi:hypothetical protein